LQVQLGHADIGTYGGCVHACGFGNGASKCGGFGVVFSRGLLQACGGFGTILGPGKTNQLRGRFEPWTFGLLEQRSVRAPEGSKFECVISNAMKKGRLLSAPIAGEGFEPPTFGL